MNNKVIFNWWKHEHIFKLTRVNTKVTILRKQTMYHFFPLILYIRWKKYHKKQRGSNDPVSHKSAVNFVFYIFTFYFKGNPTYIDSPSIVNPLTSKVFELGEVLQLQCTGEKDFRTQTDTVKYHLYICIYLKGDES